MNLEPHEPETYWKRYETCPQCHAEPSQPCIDMRYYSRFNDTAHRGRRKVKEDA